MQPLWPYDEKRETSCDPRIMQHGKTGENSWTDKAGCVTGDRSDALKAMRARGVEGHWSPTLKSRVY